MVDSQTGAGQAGTSHDVAVVGFGPAGEVLASTLGAAGLNVVVIERWPTAYPLPRLTTLDGECCRIVQACGTNVDAAFESTTVQEACHFVDAQGEHVHVVQFPGQLGGWPERVSMYQPDIERSLHAKLQSMPNVHLMLGWEGLELWQDADGVQLLVAPTKRTEGSAGTTPQMRTLKVKYLVGCDGARSFVRGMLGVGMKDHNMHQRWLNYDCENLKPLAPQFQKLNIFMDPQRPHMYMPIGKRGLRLEYRVADDETDEYATTPGVAEQFMREKYGLDPADFRIMRRVVYHYRTRMAEQWRVGRVFLAGDAAHTMPPFMGQGACSAIRDGRNLGWKLAQVLKGQSKPELLDTYRAEREPHVTPIVMGSDMLSRVVNITDPVAAAKRNEDMRVKPALQSPPLPTLQTGVLHRDAAGNVVAPAGHGSPQGRLRRSASEVPVRGDELLGNGFQLWCRKDPSPGLGQQAQAVLQRLGCTVAAFDDPSAPCAYDDVEGVYRAFLDRCQADAVIVRPDFYVFGAVSQAELPALVHELAQQLHSVPQ